MNTMNFIDLLIKAGQLKLLDETEYGNLFNLIVFIAIFVTIFVMVYVLIGKETEEEEEE